jgi:hypothetical protein
MPLFSVEEKMDSRAMIKIEFEAYGIKVSKELCINYWPNGSGVDNRIIDTFKEIWELCSANIKHQDMLESGYNDHEKALWISGYRAALKHNEMPESPHCPMFEEYE